MNTFIRVVEVWVPSHDRTYLKYSGGRHNIASRFDAASGARYLARGDGLPGKVWEQAMQIVLKELLTSVSAVSSDVAAPRPHAPQRTPWRPSRSGATDG